MKRGSHPVPKVGDTVVLNDEGLGSIFGHGAAESLGHMKTLRMKITDLAPESLTAPELTFAVSVDNPMIDRYMIDHWHFDVVVSAPTTAAPVYEHWGSPEGREGVQRTLHPSSAQDTEFLLDGIRTVGADGKARRLTMKEANLMGIRRVTMSKDIRTGEFKPRDDDLDDDFCGVFVL